MRIRKYIAAAFCVIAATSAFPIATAAYGDTVEDDAIFGYVKDISGSSSTWVRPKTEHGAYGTTIEGSGILVVTDNTGSYPKRECYFPTLGNVLWCVNDHGANINHNNAWCVWLDAGTTTFEQGTIATTWDYGYCV